MPRPILGILNGITLRKGDYIRWGSLMDVGEVIGVEYPNPPTVPMVMLVVRTRDYPARRIELYSSIQVLWSPADKEPTPMALRFGPRLDHTIPTESTPAATPEPTPDKLPVEIEAGIDSASPIGDGLFTLNVVAIIPPYSAETSKRLLKIFAVAVPDGQPLPETEQGFLDSPYPKAELEVSQELSGHRQVFPIHGATGGKNTVQFVLQDED